MNRDDLASGNGTEIMKSAYAVLDLIQGWSPSLQIQAVGCLFLAIINSLNIKPNEVFTYISNIINEQGQSAQMKGLQSYIAEEMKGL